MTASPYRVLARKYRPSRFADLVGQDVLVRTLTNAITTGRLAHAFLLTGIRGVGKTTTARIIARSLNCIGANGQGGPTPEPCGACQNCIAILEDRHIDVIEMDAASRTGVGDIREIIETVQYAPALARYKIYIIDEVHMLSSNAFNALLKTLEEPPPHVKFVFATTETRKIPVTILSRCQRFDLARVKLDTLAAHLKDIAARENISAEDEALAVIASAGEGSVRDSLSLLDQAIAHAAGSGGNVTAVMVRDMLGLADKSQAFDLLEATLGGEVEPALAQFRQLYDAGAEPLMLLQDMLGLLHFISRMKLVPTLTSNLIYSETERTRASKLAATLPTAHLARAWQMVLKGLGEARQAPDTLMAAEMALIRLMHVVDLPTPAETIRTLESGLTADGSHPQLSMEKTMFSTTFQGMPYSNASTALAGDTAPATAPLPTKPVLSLVEIIPEKVVLESFDAVVEEVLHRKEMVLYSYLKNAARLVSFMPGRIELGQPTQLPSDFTARLARALSDWTDTRWTVTITAQTGAATLAECEIQRKESALVSITSEPLVKNALEQFPGARVVDIR